MNILHINCNYVGTTLHQTMIENLEQKGLNNRVFVPVYHQGVAVIEVNDYVTISECFNKIDRLCFDYKQNKIKKAVQNTENIAEFDLIHAYTVFTDGNVVRDLAKKYHKPYVVAVRNTDVNTFFKYMIHMRKRGVRILKDASAVFFLSPKYKEIVFQNYLTEQDKQIIEQKSYIIPNAIDDFWLENRGDIQEIDFKNKPIRLIYAGRINKNKNILQILKSMDYLAAEYQQVCQLTIVGKIEDQDYFNEIMKHPEVRYLGLLTKEQLAQEYRNNHIFVMPSHHETFGLVYAEAMSQGLPIIYTKGQGFDGQFEEGLVGYHTNADDTAMLADNILKITKNYEEISNNCIKQCKKFNWKEICEKYKDIYSSIVDSKEGFKR